MATASRRERAKATHQKSAAKGRGRPAEPDSSKLPSRLADGLSLFVVILAVAGLALVAFHLARAGARDEVWDKRAFLSAGVIALASALWVGLGKQPSSIWVGVAAAAATLGMFVGIGSLELHPGFEIMFPALWQG